MPFLHQTSTALTSRKMVLVRVTTWAKDVFYLQGHMSHLRIKREPCSFTEKHWRLTAKTMKPLTDLSRTSLSHSPRKRSWSKSWTSQQRTCGWKTSTSARLDKTWGTLSSTKASSIVKFTMTINRRTCAYVQITMKVEQRPWDSSMRSSAMRTCPWERKSQLRMRILQHSASRLRRSIKQHQTVMLLTCL